MHADVNTVYVDRDLRVAFADGRALAGLASDGDAVLDWVSELLRQPVRPLVQAVLDGGGRQRLTLREAGSVRTVFLEPDRSADPPPGCALVTRQEPDPGSGFGAYLGASHPVGIFEYRLIPPVRMEGPLSEMAMAAARCAILVRCNDAFAAIHKAGKAEQLVGSSLVEVLGDIERVRTAALEFGGGMLHLAPAVGELEITIPGTSVHALIRDGCLAAFWGSRTETVGAVDASGMGLFERLSELVPAIVYAVDPSDFTLHYLNSRGHDLLGSKPGQKLPSVETLLPRLHPEDVPIGQRALARWRTASPGESVQNRYRLLAADGSWRWMLDHSRVCGWDAAGQARMVIGTTVDITEHEKAETARTDRAHHRMSADRLETIGLFSRGISHDFANVLSVIDTLVPMIQSDAEEVRNEGVALVQLATAQGHELARQLADFARGVTAKRTRFHLDEDLRRFVAMVRSTLPLGGVRLPPELPRARITAHRGQIHQVLLNLFLNAREATPRGDVRFELEAERRAGLTGYTIRVIDQGVGMAPHVADRMFEPYFSGGDGSGIGLAVVKSIVASHDGAIDVRTAPGAGTTVSVWLPDSLPSMPPGAIREEVPES